MNPELLSVYTKTTKEQIANEVIELPPKETTVLGRNYAAAKSKAKKIILQPKLGQFLLHPSRCNVRAGVK